MAELSVIIPSRNEPYLEQTIRNVLDNIRGDTEILVILDGYLPDPPIETGDPRVIFIHYAESIGQRQGINVAAKQSTAKYIMKLDAHCTVAEGFDVELCRTGDELGRDVTQVPTMYNLDINTFERKKHKRTDYMYIGWNDKGELRSLYYENGLRPPQNKLPYVEIDDIMTCMGPGFFMNREWFLEHGGCDENHGSWGQQGIEVACKAWLSGGRMVVNKRTWFSHWFRGGSGPGFPYHLSGRQVDKARKYSKELWVKDTWPLAKRKFQWLVDKFDPPTWKKEETESVTPAASADEVVRCKEPELFKRFYADVHRKKGAEPTWRGNRLVKLPNDMILYAMAIQEKQPDFIVEIGTAYGASALFFADMLTLNGKGQVITIDPAPRDTPPHPRVTYLKGDSKDDAIIEQVKQIVGDGSVMLSIDGDHTSRQVKWELKKYRHIVTSGQYMVVEDCYHHDGHLYGPGVARDWFLKWNRSFTLTNYDDRFLVAFTRHGWLLKK